VTLSALVVGYGSIGQRHARVLEGLGQSVAIVSRRGSGDGRSVYTDLAGALAEKDFNYVVVADETARHVDSLKTLSAVHYCGSVLVEKPLFAWPAALPGHTFARSGVGYNLRFHPAIQALRESLHGRSVQLASFYVGQWLPDWRPGRDGQSSYSASRAAGGGVLRDLSHELDLATWLFGSWRHVAALGGRLGSITIDADDGWGILLACEKCPVINIQLNSLDRVPRRNITIQADGRTFYVDLIAGSLQIDGRVQNFDLEPDTTYAGMHRALLAGSGDVCSLAEGMSVVELVAAVERAAEGHRWIDRAA
jgi:predicted dehydrogenase